jgi:hypothetical protein
MESGAGNIIGLIKRIGDNLEEVINPVLPTSTCSKVTMNI